MVPSTQRIPDGFHTVTPYLVVNGASAAIDFYKKAFGAEEVVRMPMPNDAGKILHAQVRIGNSYVMLADEFGGCSTGPGDSGSTPVALHLYVEDADAAFARAVDAGAEVRMPLMDMFWGDRYGQLVDPFGHSWSIAMHVHDYTPEEMAKGAAEAFAAHAAQSA